MARVNRWKQFGDAYNAVYNAGTSFGQAIEVGGIAFKDYEDEEGNKLTGLALDRARTDDYAAAEQKWGDPMEALRMRTGVETLGQSKLQTDYLTDTYDERVWQGGKGASQALRANTGLTLANTGRINLDTEIREGSKTSEISANTAKFDMEAIQSEQQGLAYKDPSYLASLTSAQESAAAESAANTVRFKSKEYKDFLTSKDLADTAENRERYVKAELNRSVLEDPEHQSNWKAEQIIKGKTNLSMAANALAIQESPETLAILTTNLKTMLNNAEKTWNDSLTQLKLSENADFQANQYAAGLSNAEALAATSANQVILAERSLKLNTWIDEWSKTADFNDPTSMTTFLEGIKTIDPELGMQLEKNYGEHELWEITNESLRMKAEANQAMATNGVPGVVEILDKYNGDKLGIQLKKNDDGSFELVETQTTGYGPGQSVTEVVRSIASGANEQDFMRDIDAVLDPASLMNYAKDLADIRYKDGQIAYTEALTQSALARKPLTVDQWVAKVLQDPKATDSDMMNALQVLFKDNPEGWQAAWDQYKIDSGAKEIDGNVPEKIPSGPVEVDVTGPKTEEEEAAANDVLNVLAETNMPIHDLTKYLEENQKLIAKYSPTALIAEQNKLAAAEEFVNSLIKDGTEITPETLTEFMNKINTAAERDLSGRNDKGGVLSRKRDRAIQMRMALRNNPVGVLNVVIAELQNKISTTINTPDRTGKKAKDNIQRAEQLEQLQKLIETLMANR